MHPTPLSNFDNRVGLSVSLSAYLHVDYMVSAYQWVRQQDRTGQDGMGWDSTGREGIGTHSVDNQ